MLNGNFEVSMVLMCLDGCGSSVKVSSCGDTPGPSVSGQLLTSSLLILAFRLIFRQDKV